jgi:hypothetical protein
VALEVAGSNPVFHPITLRVILNIAGMRTYQNACGRFIYVFALLCYLWVASRPAFPYIRYQIQNDYYASVLCVNKSDAQSNCKGKCALRKEIQAQEQGSENSHSLPLELRVQDLTEPHLPNSTFTLYTPASAATAPKPQNQPNNLYDGYSGPATPPPRA